MKGIKLILMMLFAVVLAGCSDATPSQVEAQKVSQQQDQYGKGQPVPAFNWSLERDLLIKLYTLRNQKVATHAVWRSDFGMIEGDCPSIGYGLPYDTSLTNPLVATNTSQEGTRHTYQGGALTSIEQAEPNGVFASKNTSATWIMCVGAAGSIEPVYVEAKVTIYPGPVDVDYLKDKVTRSGEATASIDSK